MADYIVVIPIPKFIIHENFNYCNIDFIRPWAIYQDNLFTDFPWLINLAKEEPIEEITFSEGIVHVFEDGNSNNNLSKLISASTGIDGSMFFDYTLVSFRITDNEFLFENPTRESDEKFFTKSINYIDSILDTIRVDYCRFDVPHTAIGCPGFIQEINMRGLFVYSIIHKQGRIIAREDENVIIVPGEGLELSELRSDNILKCLVEESYTPDLLGAKLQRLLRIFGICVTLPTDEIKILTAIFALDGLLTPSRAQSEEFKKAVAKLISKDADSYNNELTKFRDYYKNVRNSFVHHGLSYEELGRNRKKDLLYIQTLVVRLLYALVGKRNEKFDSYWSNLIASL
ncbi:MAG: hypothetical protein AAGU75_14070 [Bacillota bacterium]